MFLTEVCQYLRNWFKRDIILGAFKVEDGSLTYADGSPLPLVSGQYFRIVGSLLNDGVHQVGEEGQLIDETPFVGAVWSMAIPPAFLSLVSDIEAWITANAQAINSPYSSESFGGYSYSIRGGGSSLGGDNGGSGISWQSQFAARLAPWRKI